MASAFFRCQFEEQRKETISAKRSSINPNNDEEKKTAELQRKISL